MISVPDVVADGSSNANVISVGAGVVPSDKVSFANTSIATGLPNSLFKSSSAITTGGVTAYSILMLAGSVLSFPSSSNIVYSISVGSPVNPSIGSKLISPVVSS